MAKNWIGKVNASIKRRGTKGSFRRWLGKKEGEKVTSADIAKGLRAKSPAIRKKAALAKAFKGMNKKAYGGTIAGKIRKRKKRY